MYLVNPEYLLTVRLLDGSSRWIPFVCDDRLEFRRKMTSKLVGILDPISIRALCDVVREMPAPSKLIVDKTIDKFWHGPKVELSLQVKDRFPEDPIKLRYERQQLQRAA